MIAGVELLTLGVVDAQVERITVDLVIGTLGSMAEVFKRLQALETRQAAHHRQDARVEGAHQFARLAAGSSAWPQSANSSISLLMKSLRDSRVKVTTVIESSSKPR